MIYLDHNATTDIHPQVLRKVNEVIDLGPINPSSTHSNGQIGKRLLQESRNYILSLLGLRLNDNDYRVIFTSSGTEANNLIISSFKNYEIFISAIEHSSIYIYTKYIKNITVIKVNKQGVLDINDLTSKLKNSSFSKKIVSVMFANNETGIIQPIKEICKVAHRYRALVHSDCVQAMGKVDVNISNIKIDCASISGHKFGAPMGVGALIVRNSIDNLIPQIIGGGQERSLRAGTENVPSIVGLGIASKVAKDELKDRFHYMSRLRSRLENGLLATNDSIEIVGAGVPRLPNTSLILHSNKTSETQLIALDLRGVSVSSGSACSSGTSYSSHVLLAMGYTKNKLDTAFRVSLGIGTTDKEIDKFITIYNEINE